MIINLRIVLFLRGSILPCHCWQYGIKRFYFLVFVWTFEPEEPFWTLFFWSILWTSDLLIYSLMDDVDFDLSISCHHLSLILLIQGWLKEQIWSICQKPPLHYKMELHNICHFNIIMMMLKYNLCPEFMSPCFSVTKLLVQAKTYGWIDVLQT